MKKYIIAIIILILIIGGVYILNNLRKHKQIIEIVQNTNSGIVSGIVNDEKKEEPQFISQKSEIIGTGEFTEIDRIHKGTGKAIFERINNQIVIKFEDFTVTNGPDLYVYLSKNQNIKATRDLGEYISLGTLKSSTGDQSYNAPSDINDYKSIVIWCRAFGILFSVAELE